MKKQRLLFTLLMAIVMMAFSPTRAWAQCDHEEEFIPHGNKGTHFLGCRNCGAIFISSIPCTFVNGVCEYCGYQCKHVFDDRGVCDRCGYECTHEDSTPNGESPASGHHCNVCNNELKHEFDIWSECTKCGYECTHEGSTPSEEDPEQGHDCNICGYSLDHDFVNNTCITCGYVCHHESGWNSENGRCPICYSECDHNCDAVGHCSICGATCQNIIVTIGGVSKRHFDIYAARDAACEAGEPATITLLQDCTMPNDDNLAFRMGEVTLDLNGHTLTGAYTTVIFVYGGALTITDSSAEKTGTIVNSMRSIDAYYGSLTIHGGTFISNGYNAILCYPDDEETLTVSIDGGRFISEGENSAISSKIADDILAPGYGFYNTDTDARLTYFDENQLMNENGNPASDVTVKAIPVLASVTTSSGTVEYTDIIKANEDAVNAGEPATITLLHDVTLTGGNELAYSKGEVTFDLNGHTITGCYASVVYIYNGSLTITDNSPSQTGRMVNDNYVINALGGSITILAGTFESTYDPALHVYVSPYSGYAPPTVSIEGGRFITNGETSAIYLDFGTNILAPGYGFFNTDTGALLTDFNEHYLLDENSNPAKDVMVRFSVIDELSLADATQYDGENAGYTVTDFTYTRNFGGTNWTTWYVPFDLELTDEICQKLAFSRINNVHQYDDDDNGVPDRTVIESFRQKAGVTLRANYPYLVKVLNDADHSIELRLSNVTLAPARENSIDCNSVDYIYTFTGTYSGMSDSGANSNSPYALFDDVADNQWYHFHNLEPQRHYMVIEPVNGSLAPHSLKVRLNVLGEEDATGIVTIYSEKEKMQGETYDLMGRKLTGNSAQRGLRIQNGKVIFNK